VSYRDFENRIQNQFPSDWQDFLASLEKEPTTSIRYNPRKVKSEINTNIPWAPYGKYLDERPSFTFDPLFHLGQYYVQESSSMFIDYVLSQIKKEISLNRVLDLCAAPGGKSTIVLDHLESHQFLISNELISQRNLVLRENLTKWGYPNFLITENKPADFKFLNQYFDCILLDAPCSGEGLFRKDKNARDEWSLGVANMCSERQYDIFKSIWSSLKEGGVMIYSTCTYNPYENELLLEKLLNDGFLFETIEIETKDEWNIDTVCSQSTTGYQFLPHKVKGEGFYCSVLRKTGHYISTLKKPTKDHINPWLLQYLDSNLLNGYSSYKFKNSLFLAPNYLLDELPLLSKHFYVKQIGIEVEQYKGLEIEPLQGIALLHYEKKGLPLVDLNQEQALVYLSLEELHLNLSDGLYLLTYENQALGFAKVEKTKFFNLYPSGWKIRSKRND
jgi:16S rRNA C967 or C1407 C5-methylase (RsmB/RsmF family)/NOL1/NOP2/fmu family ribosome biogenesis protein